MVGVESCLLHFFGILFLIFGVVKDEEIFVSLIKGYCMNRFFCSLMNQCVELSPLFKSSLFL